MIQQCFNKTLISTTSFFLKPINQSCQQMLKLKLQFTHEYLYYYYLSVHLNTKRFLFIILQTVCHRDLKYSRMKGPRCFGGQCVKHQGHMCQNCKNLYILKYLLLRLTETSKVLI